jgi:hypothetical protein
LSKPTTFDEPVFRFGLPRRGSGVLDERARAVLLEHTGALLKCPTAPYAEDLQVDQLARFARARPGIRFELAAGANVLLHWPGVGRTRRGAPLAFSAHLDHPGFLYVGRRNGVHTARFHGGVPVRAMHGAEVRFFDPSTGATTATARVDQVAVLKGAPPLVAFEDFVGRAASGAPGMWDLPAAYLSGTRLDARVCDDLLGAAAVLALLDLLAAERHPRPVLGIFTRAEETGFVGCQALLREGALPKGTAVVGLECSPRRSTARVGRGPVLRVGDAASVFDPAVSQHLQDCAAALAQRVPAFRVQRALMDGGRCESTAYNLWGVPAGGLCLALGGYHNVGDSGSDRGRIAPEFVDWNDYEGLLALLLEVARSWGTAPPSARMRARLDGVWAAEEPLYTQSARRIAQSVRASTEAPSKNLRRKTAHKPGAKR